MKNGQDYMRKASTILSKAPESESTEDNIESKVCYLYSMIMFIFFYLIYFIDRRKSKILPM